MDPISIATVSASGLSGVASCVAIALLIFGLVRKRRKREESLTSSDESDYFVSS